MTLFSLASGAVLHVACENLPWHDSHLFRRGDIILGDRASSDYASLAELPRRGVGLLARLHQGRMLDFRKPSKRLGKLGALFRWSKNPARPKHMTSKRAPRAIKRRPNPYPRLTRPRNSYVEIPHRNRCKKCTTRKSKGLI